MSAKSYIEEIDAAAEAVDSVFISISNSPLKDEDLQDEVLELLDGAYVALDRAKELLQEAIDEGEVE